MKKIFICIAASGIVLGLNFKALTSSSQPPAGYTGAPGDSNCASSGCHSGNLNTGSGSVALINPPTGYTPGTTYTLQIQVNQTGRTRFGFELVALNSSNQQAGTLTLINTGNTALQTLGGKTYVSHKNANSNNTWTFNWTAPSTNIGQVKFYFSGNAANGDGNTTGDNIYTSNITLSPITGINEEQQSTLKLFPNPASSTLNITNTEEAKALTVFNITGQEVLKNNNGEKNKQLDVSNLPNGTYFLQVEQAKTIQLKRFVVQH